MHLKTAHDTLSDPIKRFAYERFSLVVIDLEWSNCKSISDYLSRGVLGKTSGYIGSLLVRVILSALGKLDFGKYVSKLSCSIYKPKA